MALTLPERPTRRLQDLRLAVTGRTFATSYESDSAVFGTPYRKALFGLLLAALVLYPSFAPLFWVNLANLVAIAIMGALALNLLLGVAGQLSLASGAFMGIGGFMVAGFAVQEATLPFPLLLVIGAAACGVAAVPVGFIALRVRGLYFVLATIALHFIVVFLMQEYQDTQVGPAGFLAPDPAIGSWTITSLTNWYFVLLFFAGLTTVVATNLLRGRSGRAWFAIKDRDIAAEIMGVNVTKFKLLAFVVTSMIIGVQGVLFAYYLGVVSHEAYTLDLTIQYVAMIIIGGLGSVVGSIFGAVFVTIVPFVVRDLFPLLPSWLPGYGVLTDNTFAIQSMIFGLAIVFFMRVAPGGLVELWRRFTEFVRSWPFPREELEVDT